MSARVLVIGASGGIGAALSEALRARDAEVTTLSRAADGFDVTDEASVNSALEGLTGPFDAVIVATGALEIDGAAPEKSLRTITQKAMLLSCKPETGWPWWAAA